MNTSRLEARRWFQQAQADLAVVCTLRRMIAQRDKAAVEHQLLSQQLYNGRRTLLAALVSLYRELLEQRPKMAVRFSPLTTHWLLRETEEKLVNETLHSLSK